MGLSSNSFSGSDFLLYEIAVNQKEMQPFDRPSNHHTEARSPGQPTPPFTPRDTERLWAGHYRSIYPMTV
ncbi:hypothetical protein PO909_019789 [Leuciscus waleckii]